MVIQLTAELKRKERSDVDGHYYSWCSPYIAAPDRREAKRIFNWVLANMGIDELDHQNFTTLAELLIDQMGLDKNGWTKDDDDTHIVWDVAVDLLDYFDLEAE